MCWRSAVRHSSGLGAGPRPDPRYQRVVPSRPTAKRARQALPGLSSRAATKCLSIRTCYTKSRLIRTGRASKDAAKVGVIKFDETQYEHNRSFKRTNEAAS